MMTDLLIGLRWTRLENAEQIKSMDVNLKRHNKFGVYAGFNRIWNHGVGP